MYRKVNTVGRGRATAMLFGFGRFGALPSYQDKTYTEPLTTSLTTMPLTFQPLTATSLPAYQDLTAAPISTVTSAPKTALQVDVVATRPAPDDGGGFVAPVEMTKPLVREQGDIDVAAGAVFTERAAQVQEAVEKEVTATREATSKEALAEDLEDEARRQANFEDAQRLLGDAERARRDAAVAKEVVVAARQERTEAAQKPPEVLLADAGVRKTKKWAWIAGGALLVKFLLF